MRNRITHFVAIVAIGAAAGCSQQDAGARGGAVALNAPTSPSLAASIGGTLKETLVGAAINGVVPEGQALADESQFASGGSTILTVQIKKVNLPDGTVLGVAIDFTPIGTITLGKGEGTLTTSLGHFAVSRDQVTVKSGATTILAGGLFN